MPNRGSSPFPPMNGGALPPEFSGFSERLRSLEGNYVQQRGEIHEIRTTMATQEDVRNITTSIAGLAGKIDQMRTPQWQAIGVGVTVLALLGAMVYWPIREKQNDQADRVTAVERLLVPRVEHEREWRRMENNITELRATTQGNAANMVPREIFRQSAESLQKQLDDLRKDVGGVVTTRDVLQSYEKKIERLELELRTLAARNGHRVSD